MAKGVYLARAAALCALLFLLGSLISLRPEGEGREKAIDAAQAYVPTRAEAREREIAQLTGLMENTMTSQSARQRAEERLLWLLAAIDQEYIIEAVLSAGGYEGAVCTVSERSVNVLLPADSITESEAEAIFALVMRETGQSGNNIKVIPLN